MCKAISLISIPDGKEESWVYFTPLEGRVSYDSYPNDSHSHIAYKANKECSFLQDKLKIAKRKRWASPCDVVNKWEWNPFTGHLIKDRINCRINDYAVIRDFVDTLKPEEVIGTEVRLTHRCSFDMYNVQFRKGRSWGTLYGLKLGCHVVPKRLRAARPVKATVYRKRDGTWGVKDFK